ncbi:hypothetical protein J6590_019045 [Homalodisca vitripennis]|nr:hypothetical protein J6590_019045 [Homalodisca vitripennis]
MALAAYKKFTRIHIYNIVGKGEQCDGSTGNNTCPVVVQGVCEEAPKKRNHFPMNGGEPRRSRATMVIDISPVMRLIVYSLARERDGKPCGGDRVKEKPRTLLSLSFTEFDTSVEAICLIATPPDRKTFEFETNKDVEGQLSLSNSGRKKIRPLLRVTWMCASTNTWVMCAFPLSSSIQRGEQTTRGPSMVQFKATCVIDRFINIFSCAPGAFTAPGDPDCTERVVVVASYTPVSLVDYVTSDRCGSAGGVVGTS